MTTATTPQATSVATKRSAAMAVVSFDKQMKHARELVTEGRRLLGAANRDLSVGTVLVRRSHQRLTDTEAYFRRNPNPLTIASR